MTGYFPSIYHDELLYSQLARFYTKSGYLAYTFAAQDLFVSKSMRPDIEFLNDFKLDAFATITKNVSITDIVMKHTMFPYYARFMNHERREKAFDALITLNGNYHNLLAIPKSKNSSKRVLRYCSICAKDDRLLYGETYWHRTHQLIGVNICPTHYCSLLNSNVVISGKIAPSLIAAEEVIPKSSEIVYSSNKIEHQVSKYIAEVFQSNIDLQSSINVGDFLHSKMAGTKYRSVRGEQRNISLLHSDFCDYYKNTDYNWFTELWKIQKIFTNDRTNLHEICLLAFFLNVSIYDLTNMALPEKSQEQLFDEKVFELHEQGLNYVEISKRLIAPIVTVKAIGGQRYKKYRKPYKKPLKSGAKPQNWEQIDIETLPLVISAIKQLHGDGATRPKKVTLFAVERLLNLKSKQINNLPKCKTEITNNYESQEEYWAREVVWAAKKVSAAGQSFNWKHIRTLTNIRKRDLEKCAPFIHKFSNDVLTNRIKSLI